MRDYTYRYAVVVRPVSGYQTPSGWATRSRVGHQVPPYLTGKPTDAKLARWVADYHASLLPGGVNSHLGDGARLLAAEVRDGGVNGTVVASWKRS